VKHLLISLVIFGTFLLAPMAQAATKTFTGGAGTTDWNTPGNWNPKGVPGATDDVTIPSGQTVTNKPFAALGTGFINSLTLLGTLTITSSGLNLQSATASSSINNLTLTGSPYSQFTMQGPATFSGNLVLSPGLVNGPGAATITGTVTVSNSSSLTPATVVNKGSITVAQNNLQVTLGDTNFVNDKTGSIALQGDGITIRGNGTFTNSGSIAKSMGTGSSIFSPSGPFSNSGSIAAQSGTLQLSIVGTNTGAFTASAGAILQFANAITLNGGTTIGGSGTIDITAGGVWDVEALVTVDTTNMTFNGATGTMIRGNSNLTINSVTVGWSSGVLGAQTGSKLTLNEGVTMEIVTNGYHGLAMNLDLLGTVNMSADLQLSEPTITIEANAHFNILTDNGIHGGGNIYNGGIFQKTQGTGYSHVDYGGTFNITAPKGSHPVTVASGVLIFAVNGGGVLGGIWTVDSGAQVYFSDGTYTLPDGSKFIGAGTTSLNSANWNLTGNVSVSTHESFTMVNSTISGAFDLTLSSSHVYFYSGTARTGEIQNNKPVGTIKITRGAQTSVVGSLTLDACTLDNSSGSFVITGTVVVQDSAVLVNEKGGTISLDVVPGVTTPAIQLSSGAFSNLGTVTLGVGESGNPTQIIAGEPWDNSGNLIVPKGFTLNIPKGYVNLGGATTIKGGTIILGGPMDLEGGTLDGTGSVNGSAGINDNGATIEAGKATPGSGTGILSLSVPLTQGTGAAITALISGTKAGTQYDQINSTSSITLGGTLNLQFGTGFTPTPSESFNILNFSSATGSFSTVNAPTGFTAHLNFTSTALIVTFTAGHSVSIQPKAATVMVDGTRQFTGAVSVGNAVRWSVTESGGGTVTQTGLYTAPGTPGTYHMVVTSVADKTKSDTATVTVTALVADGLTVTPQAAILQPGAVLRLQANQSVVWSVSEGNAGGRVTADGSYTAPRKSGLYHVVATSAEKSTNESTNHAVVNIVVGNGKLKSAYVADVDHNSISVLSGLSDDDASSGSATGQLQEIESRASGQRPLALAISPDGKLLLSANEDSNDISLFALSHTDSALGVLPGNSFAVGAQPRSVKFDPSGRLVFVTNQGSDDVSVFSVDASGQLIFLRSHALAPGDMPSDVAVHPGGSMVYVINAGTNGVRGFAYDAAGMLKPVDGSGGDGSPIAAGTGPEAAVIDSAGKFLFVANRGSSDVSVFAIDATNQTLQEVSGSPFKAGKGAAAIAIDITGSYLFVADHEANDIVSFQIDCETGALTPRGRTSLTAAGPSSLAVDPSGQYVYVTSDQTGGVTILKLNVATGELALSGTTMSKGKTSSIVLTGSAATPAQAP
jgi:6-phosphogluconolactonase